MVRWNGADGEILGVLYGIVIFIQRNSKSEYVGSCDHSLCHLDRIYQTAKSQENRIALYQLFLILENEPETKPSQGVAT